MLSRLKTNVIHFLILINILRVELCKD